MKNFKILFLRGFWGVTQSDEYVLMPNQGGLIIWRVKHKTGAHDEAPFQTGFKCKKKVPKIKTRQMINPHWKWKLWGEKLQKIVQKSALKPWKKKTQEEAKTGENNKKELFTLQAMKPLPPCLPHRKVCFWKIPALCTGLGWKKGHWVVWTNATRLSSGRRPRKQQTNVVDGCATILDVHTRATGLRQTQPSAITGPASCLMARGRRGIDFKTLELTLG